MNLRFKQWLKHYAWVRRVWRFSHPVRKESVTSWGGDFPDKCFYIIGTDDCVGGAWWLIQRVLMHVAYAKEKGYIPVVDMLNYKNQYQEANARENVWESFFLQPEGYSLELISKAKNVVINSSCGSPSDRYNLNLGLSFFDNQEMISIYRDLCKQYLIYTNEFRDYLESQELLIKGKRLVGVLCRGTDYVKNRPQGHLVQPEPRVVVDRVKCVMKEYACEGVFLATEDADVYELFQREFGDSLFSLAQHRVSKGLLANDQWLSDLNRVLVKEKKGEFASYFASTYLLSRCACFVAGRTCGSMGVMMLTSGFEYTELFDLGVY